jgi:hypothetical protein
MKKERERERGKSGKVVAKKVADRCSAAQKLIKKN